MLENPVLWVAVAFVAFFAFFGKKLWKMLAGALDTRSAAIAKELSETESLRVQAEETLALYRDKYKESMREAEEIVSRAKTDADNMLKAAEAELKTTLAARTQQSMDKIAAAEKRAVAEIQHHVVDVTIAAAKSLISEHLAKSSSDDIIRQVVADIERKVH